MVQCYHLLITSIRKIFIYENSLKQLTCFFLLLLIVNIRYLDMFIERIGLILFALAIRITVMYK